MDIGIVYEDDNLLVANKPTGLVVHPGAGEHAETLVTWFLNKFPAAQNLNWPDPERAGIVHRLDKDTSGLIILAKNPEALNRLQALFQNHEIKKSYQALVFGKLDQPTGEITGFIGRDPEARRKQIVKTIHFDFQPGKVRQAKTIYKVIKEYHFKNYNLTLAEATIETGRMHQIRVHFKSIGHPVIGDHVYNIKHSRIVSKALGISRQFLHAYKLSFKNPFDHKNINLEISLPDDLKEILAKLS